MAEVKPGEVNTETNAGTESVNNDMIPKARLDEVIGQRNNNQATIDELNAKIKKFELSQESAREEKLKAKLEKADAKAGQWDTYQADRRQALTEKLPENVRYVADEIQNLTSLEKFVEDQTANANANKINSQRAGVQPGGDFGGYSSWEEYAMKDPKGCSAALNGSNKII